jgi:chromate transporter
MKFYVELFFVFFRIGIFTLGGGYAMVPLIEREVVDKKNWLGGREFIDALAIAQSLPGPIAVNTAVFVGFLTRRLPGAVVAALGTILPSFICMVVIATFFVNIRENPTVAAVFTGIRPAVAALVAASVWSLGKKARLNWMTILLALAAALAVWLGRVSPAYVVLALALVGAMFPVSAPEAARAVAEEEKEIEAEIAETDSAAAPVRPDAAPVSEEDGVAHEGDKE